MTCLEKGVNADKISEFRDNCSIFQDLIFKIAILFQSSGQIFHKEKILACICFYKYCALPPTQIWA